MAERNNPFDNPALDLLQGVITQSELPVEAKESDDLLNTEEEQIDTERSEEIEVVAKNLNAPNRNQRQLRNLSQSL